MTSWRAMSRLLAKLARYTTLSRRLSRDLEQVAAGPAVTAGGLFVVVVELPLQHTVHAAGLLLLADLKEVLALLRAVPAVLTLRVGPHSIKGLRRYRQIATPRHPQKKTSSPESPGR